MDVIENEKRLTKSDLLGLAKEVYYKKY